MIASKRPLGASTAPLPARKSLGGWKQRGPCTDRPFQAGHVFRRSLPNTAADAEQQLQPFHRRQLLISTLLVWQLYRGSSSPAEAAEGAFPAPQVGDCLECLGEVEATLNTCTLTSESCISTQNDDAKHFVPPWMYEGTREQAVQDLVKVATGGYYDPGLKRNNLNGTVGIASGDAAGFITQTVFNTVAGRPPPPRPERRVQAEFIPFNGSLVDQHLTADGSIYLRIVFGLPAALPTISTAAAAPSPPPGSSPSLGSSSPPTAAAAAAVAVPVTQSNPELPTGSTSSSSSSSSGGAFDEDSSGDGGVIDAEFILPQGDSIINVRASSRGAPSLQQGRLQLDFDQGLVLDRNLAKQQVEALRRALRWEQAPVISGFDPKFNNDKALWFERFFTPFSPPDAPGQGIDDSEP